MGAHPFRSDGHLYHLSLSVLAYLLGDYQLNENKINQAFEKAYAEWKADATQQLKTAEDEAFEALERQLSGWRKRQIEQKMDSIEKYDPSKIFIQAGWYSKEQLTNLITKMDQK
jgi:hypothetical protein